jgi:energy-coupling factor transporter ATP-binding protein EcfA2
MSKYKVYGLNVYSEIDLDYQIGDFETADVRVMLGKVPSKLENTLEETKRYIHNGEQLIYKVKKIGRFLIENGNRITIEPINRCPHRTIKLYLDGIAFSCLLAQRGVPVYHGSAVVKDGKCLLIMGSSGSGKSSLTSGLLDYGYEFITDDIIVFNHDGNDIVVNPGFPEQKLSKALINTYNLEVDDRVYYPGVIKDKFFVDRKEVFYNKPCKVHGIVYIRVSEDALSFRQVLGIEKLDVVLKNTFRSSFIKIFNKQKEQFKMSTSLAKGVSVYIIKRPYNKNTVSKQVKLLVEGIER